MIEWLDPQNTPIRPKCQQKAFPPAMSVMNCSLEVDALTDGKLGNYTCKACNSYNYCSTKIFQVDRQQGKLKSSDIFGNFRKFSELLGDVRLAFRTILKNLRKSSENGRKLSENHQKRRHQYVYMFSL